MITTASQPNRRRSSGHAAAVVVVGTSTTWAGRCRRADATDAAPTTSAGTASSGLAHAQARHAAAVREHPEERLGDRRQQRRGEDDPAGAREVVVADRDQERHERGDDTLVEVVDAVLHGKGERSSSGGCGGRHRAVTGVAPRRSATGRTWTTVS
jgi:hypothetical protein